MMSVQQAENYHRAAVETFALTSADMICAITMNYVEEAIGIARAAQRAHLPVVLSFTVETDGRLPTGQTLRGAIEQVDESTVGYPRYNWTVLIISRVMRCAEWDQHMPIERAWRVRCTW